MNNNTTVHRCTHTHTHAYRGELSGLQESEAHLTILLINLPFNIDLKQVDGVDTITVFLKFTLRTTLISKRSVNQKGVCIYIYIYTHITHCVCICVHIYINIHTCIYIYIYICVYIYIYIHTCVCACVYIYIYIIYIYICIHTYIHKYINSPASLSKKDGDIPSSPIRFILIIMIITIYTYIYIYILISITTILVAVVFKLYDSIVINNVLIF